MIAGKVVGSVVALSVSRKSGYVDCFCRVCKKDITVMRSQFESGKACRCAKKQRDPMPAAQHPPDDLQMTRSESATRSECHELGKGIREEAHSSLVPQTVPSGPLHPEYFTDTKTWEVVDAKDGRLRKARTLAALLAQFPKGTEFAGYYPDGYTEPANFGSITDARDIADRHAFALAKRAADDAKGTAPMVFPKLSLNPRKKYDHERVINLWSQGYSTQEIIALTGVPDQSVDYIRSKYRSANDARALDVREHRQRRKERLLGHAPDVASAPQPASA